MSIKGIGEKACIQILSRAISTTPLNGRVFSGAAVKWERYGEPEFRAFMDKYGILPGTPVTIIERAPDTFSVRKL